jgi:hypothetical protein
VVSAFAFEIENEQINKSAGRVIKAIVLFFMVELLEVLT